mmetsp:Transcript_65621/g.207581  ORF Transcript_65621/g.207581 Transcript_65621/m.207581 type:complete len:258 (+) Transcript_65621:263-1036(+)
MTGVSATIWGDTPHEHGKGGCTVACVAEQSKHPLPVACDEVVRTPARETEKRRALARRARRSSYGGAAMECPPSRPRAPSAPSPGLGSARSVGRVYEPAGVELDFTGANSGAGAGVKRARDEECGAAGGACEATPKRRTSSPGDEPPDVFAQHQEAKRSSAAERPMPVRAGPSPNKPQRQSPGISPGASVHHAFVALARLAHADVSFPSQVLRVARRRLFNFPRSAGLSELAPSASDISDFFSGIKHSNFGSKGIRT